MTINLVDPTCFTSAVLVGDEITIEGAPGQIPSLTTVEVDGIEVPVSAALEIQSTQGGFLFPRLSTTNITDFSDLLNTPGMGFYNSTSNALQIYTNAGLQTIATGAGAGYGPGNPFYLYAHAQDTMYISSNPVPNVPNYGSSNTFLGAQVATQMNNAALNQNNTFIGAGTGMQGLVYQNCTLLGFIADAANTFNPGETFSNGTALGSQAAVDSDSIGIGAKVICTGGGGVVVGTTSQNTAPLGTVIGSSSANSGDGGIVIGCASGSGGSNAILIGNALGNPGDYNILIGSHIVSAEGNDSLICIGGNNGPPVPMGSTGGIALGYNVSLTGDFGVAIGYNASTNQQNSYAIGIGAVCSAPNSMNLGGISIDGVTNLGYAIGINNPTPVWALDIANTPNPMLKIGSQGVPFSDLNGIRLLATANPLAGNTSNIMPVSPNNCVIFFQAGNLYFATSTDVYQITAAPL